MSVTVTNQHVAALRAYLTGDFDRFRQITGTFGSTMEGLPADTNVGGAAAMATDRVAFPHDRREREPTISLCQ